MKHSAFIFHLEVFDISEGSLQKDMQYVGQYIDI